MFYAKRIPNTKRSREKNHNSGLNLTILFISRIPIRVKPIAAHPYLMILQWKRQRKKFPSNLPTRGINNHIIITYSKNKISCLLQIYFRYKGLNINREAKLSFTFVRRVFYHLASNKWAVRFTCNKVSFSKLYTFKRNLFANVKSVNERKHTPIRYGQEFSFYFRNKKGKNALQPECHLAHLDWMWERAGERNHKSSNQ